MRKDGECFPFAVFPAKPLKPFLRRIIPLEEEYRRFREGPLQMSVADLIPAGTVALPGGCLLAFYQPGIGDEVLDPGEPLYVLYLIEDGEGADLPYPVAVMRS